MASGKIKTALEKALERAAAMPEISDSQLKEMEYFPKGQAMAGKYLHEGVDMALSTIEQENLSYVQQGIADTLLKNFNLPNDEATLETSKKALQGFYYIKTDHLGLDQIIGEVEQLFMYYQQVVEQAKASVKAQLMQKFHAAQEQLAAQYGGQIDIDIERQPEFRSELSKVLGQLNQRFEGAMQEAKEKLRTLP